MVGGAVSFWNPFLWFADSDLGFLVLRRAPQVTLTARRLGLDPCLQSEAGAGPWLPRQPPGERVGASLHFIIKLRPSWLCVTCCFLGQVPSKVFSSSSRVLFRSQRSFGRIQILFFFLGSDTSTDIPHLICRNSQLHSVPHFKSRGFLRSPHSLTPQTSWPSFSAWGHLAHEKGTRKKRRGIPPGRPRVSLDAVAYFWPPILLDKHHCSLSNDILMSFQGKPLALLHKNTLTLAFLSVFWNAVTLPKSALTFGTTGDVTNLSANRKQIPVRRRLAKCLSNLVPKCLSALVSETPDCTVFFLLKKHKLMLALAPKTRLRNLYKLY